METLNVTEEVKNKIDSARTPKLKTQNDIVEYLYEFYAENHVLFKIIDMLENGKVLLQHSKYDQECVVTWILKYKDELYEMMLTKENKVGITKIGRTLVRKYIKDGKFIKGVLELHYPIEFEYEIASSYDYGEIEGDERKIIRPDGRFGALYTFKKEEFIRKYIESKIR